ncbi:hypothetical protein NliqN6_1547 [Naganishia liquefaciens]|uniref:Uncharacterized protein n=1 Tax=Naganishia liquefaciens TaxID=104408 RepID=A0A8H3TQ50_9TREE|nr:hypothetical protein NliqN6_1547 [Naganishia liquefaciens]
MASSSRPSSPFSDNGQTGCRTPEMWATAWAVPEQGQREWGFCSLQPANDEGESKTASGNDSSLPHPENSARLPFVNPVDVLNHARSPSPTSRGSDTSLDPPDQCDFDLESFLTTEFQSPSGDNQARVKPVQSDSVSQRGPSETFQTRSLGKRRCRSPESSTEARSTKPKSD